MNSPSDLTTSDVSAHDAQTIVDTVRDPLVILDEDMRIAAMLFDRRGFPLAGDLIALSIFPPLG